MDGEKSVELSIDWGTSKWVAAYVVKQGATTSPVLPILIRYDHEVPMIAFWKDGKFIQGFAAQEMADSDPTLSDRAVDNFKLALCHDDETSEIRKRVEAVLAEFPGNKTLDMLIEEHIKSVIEDAKKAIAQSEKRFTFRQGELQEILRKMKVRITVPEMWTPQARQRMQRAARRAGLDVVVLASEAQCAFSYVVSQAKAQRVTLDRPLLKDDIVLVVDLGCGTGDLVLYKLLQNLQNLDVDVKLKQIGHSGGDLCGSSQVDQILLGTLLKRKGPAWQDETIKKLGVTERDFKRRALAAIEKIKREFKSQPFLFGLIVGINGQYEAFNLTKEEIQSALDSVIERIFKAIDKHTAKKTPDIIQVTGGFAKSGYLMDKMRKRYGERKIDVVRPYVADDVDCYPVAVGALKRYDAIENQKLPQQYGYGLLYDEQLDPFEHPDAYLNYEIWDGTNEDQLKPKPWLKRSPYDPEPKEGAEDVRPIWMLDRIRTIIEKGERLPDGGEPRAHLELMFYAPVKDPHITANYVYLERKFRKSEASTRDDKDGKEILKAGVHRWHTGRVNLPTQMLEENRFEKVTTEEGEEHWKVDARVTIRCRDQDMQTGFEILKPRPPPLTYKGLGKRKADSKHEREVVFKGWNTIWEASHSDFLE